MSVVTSQTLAKANKLPESLKRKIAHFESQLWAVDPKADADLKVLWDVFLKKLETCVLKKKITEKELTILSAYLTTTDSVAMVTLLDELSPQLMERFIAVLYWFEDHETDRDLVEVVAQFKQRILVAYRMYMFPVVFSETRIENAIAAIRSAK
tara:strand:+ start:6288 stop:6746 length:459 start_codon:yes stop_codon:yes gene_type:complete